LTAPTALLVTTVHWPATSRLAIALAKAGFKVAAITPAQHTIVHLAVVSRHYVCHRYGQTQRRLSRAVTRAIEEIAPAIVIPCDDAAVLCLHRLHAATNGNDTSRLAAILRYSLGEPSSYPITAQKGDFIRFANAADIAVPATDIIGDPATLRRYPVGTLPRVIKIDGMSGGAGVWIVRTAEAWNDTIHFLTARKSWFWLAKRVIRSGTLLPLRSRFGAPAPILMQEYIAGELANCTVAAFRGEMLACHSARVVHTFGETGPSTVSWIGHHRGIEEVAARIVRALGFSGFCGFDFILRKDDAQPLVIEMNPRPTQTCHLALDGSLSLADALFDAVTGAPRRERREIATERLVALFPQEFWRDPKSPHLCEAYHDVPWEVPYLITAYRQPPPMDWVEGLKRWMAPISRTRGAVGPLMMPLPEPRQE